MKFDFISAKQMISRNGGKIKGNRIFKARAGLKVLSAIDFLVNHCGMIWFNDDYKPKKKRKQK